MCSMVSDKIAGDYIIYNTYCRYIQWIISFTLKFNFLSSLSTGGNHRYLYNRSETTTSPLNPTYSFWFSRARGWKALIRFLV
jgi:hypothetical protein